MEDVDQRGKKGRNKAKTNGRKTQLITPTTNHPLVLPGDTILLVPLECDYLVGEGGIDRGGNSRRQRTQLRQRERLAKGKFSEPEASTDRFDVDSLSTVSSKLTFWV